MKFIHSGDFHIASSFEYSSFPRDLAFERRNDIWRSVESLIEKAKTENIDFLLLSGDLYNEEYITLSELKRLVDLFTQIDDINIFIIFGNHDPYRANSKWRLLNIPKNIYLFKNDHLEKYEFEEYSVYGISFIDDILNKDNIFKNIEINRDKKNILLLHTDIVNPNFRYQPVELNLLKSIGFDYIALGHIHKPTVIKENIMYPGSIEPLSFSEQGIHGAVLGEFKKDDLNIEFLDLSKSIFIEKDYHIDGDFNFYELKDLITNKWTNRNKKNFLRINLLGYLPEEYDLDIDSLHEELKDLVTHLEIINKMENNYNLEKIMEINRNNVVGTFVRNMLNKDMENPINKEALKVGLKVLLKEIK